MIYFSFHEMGLFDIPRQIDLIKKKTKDSQIIYVGHSMGSTSGLIYASLKSQQVKTSIKAFIFMAMPCYFEYSTSLVAQLAHLKGFPSSLQV
jgi:pimeloyl-ACP methyl ester carboxylesterase